jgi:NhaA family Na+:H+ antiporter
VALRGWAIPSATDIAFALGILSILGKRVPISLKIFLTALAVIDDLGAVILIALFYSTQVDIFSLLGAAIVSGLLLFLNQRRVLDLRPYLFLGVALWLFVLNSGVHATVAGVLLASAIPLREKGSRKASPLETLEHAIQPYVAFVIMPLFAFANAGLDLSFFTLEGLSQPIPLGLILGLFLGKQLGVLSATWLATKLAWATMPRAASWAQIYGVALLCGIGFTMSLFVGSLAYSSPDLMQQTRLGVLVGSTLSTIVGLAVLWLSSKQPYSPAPPSPES